MTLHKSRTLLLAVATLISGSAFAAESSALKVGGFVDARLQAADNKIGSGASIPEGALYFSKELEMASFMVDVPFALTSTTNYDGAIFTNRGQAYVEVKYSNGARWKLGQFDTFTGAELVDSKDIRFSNAGLISTYLPTVHTGLLLGYDMSKEMGVNLLLDRPGASTFNGQNPRFGGQFFYNTSSMHFAVAYLMDKNSTAAANNSLLDISAGMNMSGMLVDLGFDMIKTAGVTDATMGVYAQGIYELSSMISAGARFEWMGKALTPVTVAGVTTYAATNSQMALSVGPQFAMTKDLKVKVDYNLMSVTALSGGTAVSHHTGRLDAVYSF